MLNETEIKKISSFRNYKNVINAMTSTRCEITTELMTENVFFFFLIKKEWKKYFEIRKWTFSNCEIHEKLTDKNLDISIQC